MKIELIKPLEQTLHFWEDMFFCRYVAARFIGSAKEKPELIRRFPDNYLSLLGHAKDIPIIGPTKYWGELRKYLLEAPYKEDVFDVERFWPMEGGMPNDIFSFMPLRLFKWMRESRRVYHLNKELCMLLEATSLERMSWGDIVFPFGSFVVTLDEPFEVAIDNDTFLCKCIVISRIYKEDIDNHGLWGTASGNMLDFCFIGENKNIYLTPVREKDRAVSAVNSGDWEVALAILENELKKSENSSAKVMGFSLDLDNLQKRSVTESIDRLALKSPDGERTVRDELVKEGNNLEQVDQVMIMWDRAKQIVLGLCLYLQALPEKSPYKSPWQKPETNWQTMPNKSSIIGNKGNPFGDSVFVCSVTSMHSLSVEEQEVIRASRGSGGHGSKCPHFRRGHWRKDPRVTKPIPIGPVFVNKHKLAEGEVAPVGRKIKVQ